MDPLLRLYSMLSEYQDHCQVSKTSANFYVLGVVSLSDF